MCRIETLFRAGHLEPQSTEGLALYQSFRHAQSLGARLVVCGRSQAQLWASIFQAPLINLFAKQDFSSPAWLDVYELSCLWRGSLALPGNNFQGTIALSFPDNWSTDPAQPFRYMPNYSALELVASLSLASLHPVLLHLSHTTAVSDSSTAALRELWATLPPAPAQGSRDNRETLAVLLRATGVVDVGDNEGCAGDGLAFSPLSFFPVLWPLSFNIPHIIMKPQARCV